MKVVQLDSVNVLVRSQYLPLFSRLGPYDRSLLDDIAYRRRELFEYWGHEASLMPVRLRPLFEWRMERADAWGGMVRVARERPGFVEGIYREVAERGPLAAGDLASPDARRSSWWGWGDNKRALEWLFWIGRLAVTRGRNFERLYDLPERVIPSEVLATPAPPQEEAQRELLAISAQALGIGTERDLADYFRIGLREAMPRLAELVEEGRLLRVAVEGWREPAFLSPGSTIPRRATGVALLTPFDPIVWERSRAERMFGFRYRIEIYTPAPKRTFGYYVLPLLIGERLVGRVDVKADRKAGTLVVPGGFVEDDVRVEEVLEPLARELADMARWLGLERVASGDRGVLGPLLRQVAARDGITFAPV